MTITRIIGSGLVGGNLARAAIAYGYDVVISNARGTADTRRPASGTRAESLGRHRSSRGRVGDFAIVAIPPLASCRVSSHAAPLRQPS
jgi:8-hydroxy-5-deazaflavin:NADPH oxidoreductase